MDIEGLSISEGEKELNEIRRKVEDIFAEYYVSPDSVDIYEEPARSADVLRIMKFAKGEKYGTEVSFNQDQLLDLNGDKVDFMLSEIERQAQALDESLEQEIHVGDRKIIYRLDDEIIRARCNKCYHEEIVTDRPFDFKLHIETNTDRPASVTNNLNPSVKEDLMAYAVGKVVANCRCNESKDLYRVSN